MADEKGRNSFSDFDASDIFTDFETKSNWKDESISQGKSKFVVHIDDSDNDSFDYDFAAFSSASERQKEEKRREESRKSLEQFEIDKAEKTKPIHSSGSQTPGTGRRKSVNIPPHHRTAVPYRTPVRPRNGAEQNKGEIEKPHQAQVPEKKIAEPEIESGVNRPAEKKTVKLNTKLMPGTLSGLLGFAAIVIALTLILTSVGLSAIGDVLAYNRSETSITVVIENEKNGDSPTLEHVIRALHSAGLIKQKNLCVMFAKFRHYDGYTNKKKEWIPTEYISGIYYLEPELGLEGMLNMIKKSTNTGADTITLTFPEGWTVSQIFERLEKNGVCEASKLYANIEAVAKQYDFYYSINQSGLRYLGVEGYLFPDTYEFFKNENAVSVLKKLFDNSNSKWTKAYQKQAKKLGYTRDEILNIASIIQREAANSSQMGNVSSVIHNRMNSSTYPSLQCNSTLDYVTNSVKKHVDASLAEVYANAYNTYRIEGLPPGPICNPGKDAIEAALYPSETNYYFFVHNNNGKIYLSENYSQFQKDCVQVARDNAS